jgi:N-sulfoglucosamine sulfohydrolase
MLRSAPIIASLLCVACLHASDTAAPRWNILFILADDWGRYASTYARIDSRPSLNDVVATPNIDRLGHEGATFRNAFVSSPSCTPCRSSLFSGRHFFDTGRGAILRGAVWDDTIPTYPFMIRDAGYHIGKSFKVWGPGTPTDAPFGGQRYAYQEFGNDSNNFSENVTERVSKGETIAAARAAVLAQVRGNFDAFLAARKAGSPWHYYFGTTTTHRTWIKGSGKALWGIDPEKLKGKMPAFLPDVPEVREDVADYLGEVQAVDAYVGVLRARLEEIGELDRTLIVVSGDHGMPGVPSGKCNLYDHGTSVSLIARVPGTRGGRVIDDFVCLFDLMPTFLDVAGVKAPEGIAGRSLLSILRSDRQGQIDPSRTWVIAGRERHVEDAREGYLPYPMRSLRTNDYLYIHNFTPERTPMGDAKDALSSEHVTSGILETNTRAGFADMDAGPTKSWLIAHRDDPNWHWLYEFAFSQRPAEELYDLRKDPDQVKNVALDSAYAKIKAELRDQLMKTLTAAGDPRVTGDGGTFDRPPFAGVIPTDVTEQGHKKLPKKNAQ